MEPRNRILGKSPSAETLWIFSLLSHSRSRGGTKSCWQGRKTHSDFLPPPEIEEDVTPLLSLGVCPYWIWQIGILGEPHLHGFVEAPVSCVATNNRRCQRLEIEKINGVIGSRTALWQRVLALYRELGCRK